MLEHLEKYITGLKELGIDSEYEFISLIQADECVMAAQAFEMYRVFGHDYDYRELLKNAHDEKRRIRSGLPLGRRKLGKYDKLTSEFLYACLGENTDNLYHYRLAILRSLTRMEWTYPELAAV